MTVFIDDMSTEKVSLLKGELADAKRRIAHLERLVRDVEWGGARGCPWCDTIGGVEVGVDQQTGLECAFHHAECPAFTANGEIK